MNLRYLRMGSKMTATFKIDINRFLTPINKAPQLNVERPNVERANVERPNVEFYNIERLEIDQCQTSKFG
jgi:hypothetical protein